MSSDETIEHFTNMGVLRDVTYGAQGEVESIFASAPTGYGQRCMKDFINTTGYCVDFFGINAKTSDGAAVRMAFTE